MDFSSSKVLNSSPKAMAEMKLSNMTETRRYLTQRSNLDVPTSRTDSTTVFMFTEPPKGIADNMIPFPKLDPVLPGYRPFPLSKFWFPIFSGDHRQGLKTLNVVYDSRVRRGRYSMYQRTLGKFGGKPVFPPGTTIPSTMDSNGFNVTRFISRPEGEGGSNYLKSVILKTPGRESLSTLFEPKGRTSHDGLTAYSKIAVYKPKLYQLKSIPYTEGGPQPRTTRSSMLRDIRRRSGEKFRVNGNPTNLAPLGTSTTKITKSASQFALELEEREPKCQTCQYKRIPPAPEPTWELEMLAASCWPNVGLPKPKFHWPKAKTYTVYTQTPTNIKDITGDIDEDKCLSAKPGYFMRYSNYRKKMAMGFLKEEGNQVSPLDVFDFNSEALKVVQEMRDCVISQAVAEISQETELQNLLDELAIHKTRYALEENRLERKKARETAFSEEMTNYIELEVANDIMRAEADEQIRIISSSRSNLKDFSRMALESLRTDGFITDDMTAGIKSNANRWVKKRVFNQMNQKSFANTTLDDVIENATENRGKRFTYNHMGPTIWKDSTNG